MLRKELEFPEVPLTGLFMAEGACLIPEFEKGEYWESMYNGFISAAKDYSAYSINLAICLYDQTNVDSFVEESRRILEAHPSGVIMNTVFREEVTVFTKELEKA